MVIFKSMTLRTRMILGGCAAVIIPFIIAGAVTYQQLSRSLERLSEEKAKQIAVDLSALVQNTLHREFNFVSAVARDPEIRAAMASNNYGYIQKRLEDVFRLSGAHDGSLFVTDEYGIQQADADDPNRIGTDLSDRPYFLAAKAGKGNIGVPITARTTGKTGIALCFPIISEKKDFVGAAVIFQEIKFILDPINNVKLGETGYAYLGNTEGPMIVHPDREFVFKTKEEEPGLKPLVDKMSAGKTGTARYSYKGVKKMAAFAPIPITGWNIVVTQHVDEIMEPANRILNIIILGGIMFLGITVGSIVLLSKKISTPAQKAIETLKQVTFHSGEMVAIMNKDKKIEFVNLAMEVLMKRPSKDIIGTRPVLTSVNDVPEEEIWCCLDERNVWTGRLRVNRKGGEPDILETVIIPLQDGKGQIFGYLEICRNITRELMVESRLRQAQKLEAIGTLAGGIAHDFNNILSGIFGYAELALIKEQDPAGMKICISEVLKAAQRAKELVKQILTFSRQAEMEVCEVTPKYIINEALKLLRASIPATIELRTTLKSKAVIIADPTQIHQIIVNLCTNAAYAMKDGKGTIAINLEDIDVDDIQAKLYPGIKPGRNLLLRVTDTGCGIEPAIIDHIFDPFFTTKPKGEGTGLGLSLVHGIVKKMNGVVSITSEVGKGTTCEIILPVVLPAVELSEKAKEESLPHGSERIMLIDDEEQIAQVLSKILTALGYRVTIFTNSLMALDALQNSPTDFDLLITDYTMPNLTGIEIAELLKSNDVVIPVILCSGYVHQGLEEASRNAGINEILRKPFRPPEIAAAIRRVLAQ